MVAYRPFERSSLVYDIVHAGKDYDGETRQILTHLEPAKNLTPFVPRLFDVGCGTGEFTTRFANAGWQVIGIDSSETMIQRAHEKGIKACVGRVENLPLHDKVEAVTCLYGAFSYMTVGVVGQEAAALQQVLQSLRGTIRHRGLLVFDVIHAPAAASKLRDSQEQQFGDVTRKMSKRFDAARSIVYHDITYTYQGETWGEQHAMRAFSLPEMRYALKHCGFELKWMLPTFDNDPYCPSNYISNSTYYFTVVAEARHGDI